MSKFSSTQLAATMQGTPSPSGIPVASKPDPSRPDAPDETSDATVPKVPGEPPRPLIANHGSLGALQALLAALPPREFWSPAVLGQLQVDAVDDFLDATMAGRPSMKSMLTQARELRDLPVVERLPAMRKVLQGAPGDESICRALAWGARLPLEATQGRFEDGELMLAGIQSLTWLPQGLKAQCLNIDDCRGITNLPEDLDVDVLFARASGLVSIPTGLKFTTLNVARCPGITAIPAGLKVAAGLILTGCPALTALPEDLEVEKLYLQRTGLASLPAGLKVTKILSIVKTPLARLADAEIRAMAPGVTGEIKRIQ